MVMDFHPSDPVDQVLCLPFPPPPDVLFSLSLFVVSLVLLHIIELYCRYVFFVGLTETLSELYWVCISFPLYMQRALKTWGMIDENGEDYE